MNYRSVFITTVQTVGFFASGFIIPLLGQILALFTPVPLMIAYVRNGRLEGLTALMAATVIVALLGGWQFGALLLFSFGLMAVGTAEGMRRQLKPERIALLGGMLPIITLGAGLTLYFTHIGKNPLIVVEEYLREGMAEAATVYTRFGLAEMAATVTSISDTFVHYLVRLLPSITIATSVAQAAICYGIARSVIMRRPSADTSTIQSSLALWHAPDAWVWGLIVALTLLVMPNEIAKLMGWNLAILYATLSLAQGIAVVDHYLRKTRMRPVIRGMIHTFILTLPSIVFVIALGIVDIWADFRKARQRVQKA